MRETSREVRREDQPAHDRLLERSLSLLEMLLNDGNPVESIPVLRTFAKAASRGRLRVEVPSVFTPYSPLLIDAYERSRTMFAAIDMSPLLAEQQEIARTLKVVAVKLMTAGAEVRRLDRDAVPLVAYAISNRQLPVPVESASDAMTEKVNDLLLAVSDRVSEMPIEVRPVFVGLFRLAALIGEAQVYAEALELETFSFA